jgi:succinyl-diaminopimelate desuccinylase
VTDFATVDRSDLLSLTAALVAVPSVSRNETSIADAVEARLRARAPRLEVDRVGDKAVARTHTLRDRCVVLAGHLDTVPANANETPRVDGDVLHGLGSADMKGGLAVLLALAEDLSERGRDARHDATLVFYVGEEIADEFNGLRDLFERRADLVDGDLAILLEPTGGWVEAGCQGVVLLRATFRGERAHTARPWTGNNAITRAAPVLARLAGAEPAPVAVDGLEYRQALQVVRVEGGVANNVVPDVCSFVVNRRFAPSLSIDEARAEVERLLEGADEIDVVTTSPAASPNLDAPLVAEFVGTLDLAVRPKLGWTDVARFAGAGIPALNFGPGDPGVAHTANERVDRASLDGCHAVLAYFLGLGAGER